MTRLDIIKALADYYEIEPCDAADYDLDEEEGDIDLHEDDGGYDLDDYSWTSGCRFDGRWLSLATIVKILEPLTDGE